MEKLKKCPLCGGELTLFDWEGEEIPQSMFEHIKLPQEFCAGCDCGFNFELGEKFLLEEFIKRLNTRKPMERIVERLEEVSYEYTTELTDLGFVTKGRKLYLNDAIRIVKEEM